MLGSSRNVDAFKRSAYATRHMCEGPDIKYQPEYNHSAALRIAATIWTAGACSSFTQAACCREARGRLSSSRASAPRVTSRRASSAPESWSKLQHSKSASAPLRHQDRKTEATACLRFLTAVDHLYTLGAWLRCLCRRHGSTTSWAARRLPGVG